MLRLSFLISVIALLIFNLFSTLTIVSDYALIVVGGEYTVQPGETRSGKALFVFAKVKLEEGGSIEGNILSIGSRFDVLGRVGGRVRAYGSDVRLSASAQVVESVDTAYSMRGLPLFPFILMVVS